MKCNQLLLAVLLIFSIRATAQGVNPIEFRSGTVYPGQGLDSLKSFNRSINNGSRQLLVVQFAGIPTAAQREVLQDAGVSLLEYIPRFAYTALISRPLSAELLTAAGVVAVLELKPEQKMDAYLRAGRRPSWAVKSEGTLDLWFSFPKGYSAAEVMDSLRRHQATVVTLQYQGYRILGVRVANDRIRDFASLPFVEFVQVAPAEDQPLLKNSMAASKANLLNASIANGGKGLRGEGVVVGVGDNADIQTHTDFAGRLINRSVSPASGHGHHVSGIVGGAGNINELFRGYAPKATILSQTFSGILSNAATYVQDHGMVITNNSYGDIIECDYHGTYDLISRVMDQIAFDLPQLSNVFAAGNSGTSTCAPFATAFRTVLGGYQSAKNVITVGATNDSGLVAPFSSRGPVRDGRTKPEISSMGQFVASTWPTNNYSYNNGTSMAAPAVSGGLALLVQRYRQLNGGANPKNNLIKAILVNGTSDRGNVGPDYTYGFGWLNLHRSIEIIENNRYLLAQTTQGGTNQHTITIPANTAQLRVMLYWHDPAGSLLAAKTLVNDLDLQVVDGGSQVNLPRILDTSSANVGVTATTGVDRLNNMEQVIINNPAAGNYTVRVQGSTIAQGPSQVYVIVYDFLPAGLRLTSPAGGEGWVPGEQAKISWDSYGLTGTGNIEFSANNGSSWITIASNIDINRGTFTWWVPQLSTSEALIRITKSSSGETVSSNPFTIVGLPLVTLAPVQCESYIAINWTAIPGVTDYEVMQLVGDEMKTLTTTTATSHIFSSLSKDSVYWVTVHARVNGKGGRRSVAVSRQPLSGTCAGSISDNDLKMDAVVSPLTGRRFTSTQLSSTQPIIVRVKNLDDAPVAAFTISYSLNNGPWITEAVSTPLAAGGSYTHSFAGTADLSAPGSYSFRFAVTNIVADGVKTNDTIFHQVRHLDNQQLDLSAPFVDNMEAAGSFSVVNDLVGLSGLDRYDFTRSANVGRVKSFINTGIAYSGAKALTLDADRVFNAGNTNYLYGTFNLSAYHAATNDVRLDFRWLSHGNESNAANRVWIRANDSQPWLDVFDLFANSAPAGQWKKSESIELSDILTAAGQTFGTSFQVRWGQWGRYQAIDREIASGFSFDDVRFYQVANDLQARALAAPLSASCGLSASTPITFRVRNSANNTLTNVPVRYRINNGPWIAETIASISANTAVDHTFSQTANLSALGVYTVQLLVDLPADSYRENDTLTQIVRHLPMINTFPYLQQFEGGDGSWYAEGSRSSWEYGSPASMKIRKAASGSKAWKTRLAGGYNDNEFSYLYSPCFNLAALNRPMLSFSVALDIEDCGTTLCDAAWVEYSTDGSTWQKLGTTASGTNWYNRSQNLWSVQNYTYWHVASAPLPQGSGNLRLRFVMNSDAGVSREGIAIDDIHIYDSTTSIYDGPSMTLPVSSTVSGSGWTQFSSGGKIIAEINAKNQLLGATAVQAYIFNGAVRNTNNQYYHHRNITIKPANRNLSDSVTVRFYFLDKESDTLIRATGCGTCFKPSSAYDLGVSKYSDPDINFENGTISDNQQGAWSFIQNGKVNFVPFDKGYYAEFKVKDFSEFWLNNGGFDRSTPLPAKLMEFTAVKQGMDVVTQWKLGSETGVDRYEIELARGDAAMQAGQFQVIGQVASLGNTSQQRQYSFTDTEASKSGNRYYRLKTVNNDGSFTYSSVRLVQFDEAQLWQVYPNPSAGVFNIMVQAGNGVNGTVRVLDAAGKLVRLVNFTGNGQPQKITVNLAAGSFASGVYLMQVNNGTETRSFKLNRY